MFTEAYSASCHTREAVPAIITGKHPDQVLHRYYRLKEPPISQTLRRKGYRTGAFVSAPFLTAANGYADGFDTYWSSYHHDRWNLPHILEYAREIAANQHYTSGGWVTNALRTFINETEEPWFAWTHYTDVHAPYNRYHRAYFGDGHSPRYIQYLFRRAKYWPDSIDDEDRQVLVDAYDNCIRELDWWINQVFRYLRREHCLDDTVVILTADHGELFGEYGLYEHRRFLEDELLHVPLIVHTPGTDGEVVDDTVSTLDVAPTIYKYANCFPHPGPGLPLPVAGDRRVEASCVKRGRRKTRVI